VEISSQERRGDAKQLVYVVFDVVWLDGEGADKVLDAAGVKVCAIQRSETAGWGGC
jgi:hypothetical protein